MCLSNAQQSKTRQRGSALVIAIFIIIVMSLLGAALVRMLSASSEAIVYEVYGTRAFLAAQTGLQFGLQQAFPLSAAAASCATVNAATIPTLSNTQGLLNCQIKTLSCSEKTVNTIRYYKISSIGECDDGGIKTTRSLEVDAREL